MQPFKLQILRKLVLRIALPLIGTMLAMGACLYFFNLRVIADFEKRQIEASLTALSHNIYNICDRKLNALLQSGHANDPKALRISKAETIGAIEDFLRRNDVGGRISDSTGAELFASPAVAAPAVIAETAPKRTGAAVLAVHHENRDYYLTDVEFEPWSWRIQIFKNAAEFDELKKTVRSVYLVTGVVLAFSTVLLFFSLNRTVKVPVRKIIDDIRSGRAPHYDGIAEFAFLSANIGQMMTDLQESEQAVRDIAAGLGEGVYVVDTSGDIVFMNREAERLLGWSEAEVLGRAAHEVFHHYLQAPGTNADHTCPLKAVIRSGETFRCETERFSRRDGTLLPVSYVTAPLKKEGVISGAITAFQDITARQKAEEERQRLVTAIEQAGEAVFISDPEMIIHYVNPAFERISGYSAEEIIGRPSHVLNVATHYRRITRKIADTLARGDVWSGRLVNQRKDGSIYEAEATISPVRDRDGAVIDFVHIHRDITHEVRLERELRQAHKMEAIGTLAGGIAHDFNNILTGIIGYTQLALARSKTTEAQQRDLKLVLQSAQRASDLVRQILTFSRSKELERIPMQVTPSTKEALKLLRSSLPSTIEIRQQIDLKAEEDMVLADPTQVHQVLMNLCTNAAHAMRGKGGILSVKLAALEIQGPTALPHAELGPGAYVCLTVSDNGHGIDEEIIERIFDPYFTTKELGQGTGLGLAVVQGIVKGCGGAITVYSEPGMGATFNVYLPRIKADLPPVAESTEVPTGGSERILFVDDETMLVDLAKATLQSLGYRVRAENSSRQALAAFRTTPEAFDLLITDMTMPGLTGADLAREILALRPEMPIILCTGFSEQINAGQAKRMGIRGFIMKPYVTSQLAETIRTVLDRKRTVA
jgi:PAS domain S-box-containing protein